MTLELDPERVAAVTARLTAGRVSVVSIDDHLASTGHRMHLVADVAPARAAAQRLGEQLGLVAALLRHRAEQASAADRQVELGDLRTFAGGTSLCSAIQLVSPIPARPSTSGTTGVIDASGVARDAISLADTAAAPATIAGRAVPLAALVAALADTVLCRLQVGSGAGISTEQIVDEHGEVVYEGSRSTQKYMNRASLPLSNDPMARDREMWNAEHANEEGLVLEAYPGYPAYEVNAP